MGLGPRYKYQALPKASHLGSPVVRSGVSYRERLSSPPQLLKITPFSLKKTALAKESYVSTNFRYDPAYGY
jgi:hypothetical protein